MKGLKQRSVSILMSVMLAAGTVSATGFMSMAGEPEQAAPEFASSKVTLSGTDASIRLNDGTDEWAQAVTSVKVNGTALDKDQYTVSSGVLNIERTAEEPVFSVTTAEKHKDYEITVEAEGYKDLDSTISFYNYGAKTFQVRLLDGEGVVQKAETYTWEQLEAMSQDGDAYYPAICGMSGLRVFKAEGVLLNDLFKDAGIKVGEGMTIQVRTNDSAAEESSNDSETDNAYYRNGTFSYESLFGQDRYWFPGVYTNDEIKSEILAAGKFDEAARKAIGSDTTKEKIQPMIALRYVESIYRSSDGVFPKDEAYSDLISDEQAFRFLFGLAMDPEDDTMIASETTTWSATYCAFGVDVIDPSYKESVKVSDYEASTYVTGENKENQFAKFELSFDKALKVTDEKKLLQDLQENVTTTIGTTAARELVDAELSKDGKTLTLVYNMDNPPTSGVTSIKGIPSLLVEAENGDSVEIDVSLLLPNGVQTSTVSQTVADETNPASVTTKILVSDNSTRGMVHFVLLKNGVPVNPNTYGGTAIAHFHAYQTLTAEQFASMAQSALASALGEDYNVAYTEGSDTFAVTAAKSQPGDVLEVHVVSYLNNGSKTIDATALDTAIKKADAAKEENYTEEEYAELQKQLTLAKVISENSKNYSQEDVDDAVKALNSALNIENMENNENKEDGVLTENDGSTVQKDSTDTEITTNDSNQIISDSSLQKEDSQVNTSVPDKKESISSGDSVKTGDENNFGAPIAGIAVAIGLIGALTVYIRRNRA